MKRFNYITKWSVFYVKSMSKTKINKNQMKIKNTLFQVLVLATFFGVSQINAAVKLPSILANNMVLQQKTEVKLWGWSKPNTKIKISTSWDKKTYTTVADGKGNWLQKVNTPSAGGPYDISFNDGEKTTLSNILIGEVWFCSGQSNMEMPMQGFDRQPTCGGNELIVKAKSSTPIRIFNSDNVGGKRVRQVSKLIQTDVQGAWVLNESESVANVSATAYYFARYLQEVLDVPVGIVVSSLGGSAVQAWMSRESLVPFKEVDLSILDTADEITKPQSTPCGLYNAKLAPFFNFKIKGMLWYQGESNRINPVLYSKLMPAFVSDIRSKWDSGEFPFYYVQIAPYKYDHPDSISAARLHEVQLNHLTQIPNVGMVTTLDIGNIDFIHPANKEKVGERLALWALAKTYDRKGFDYAPPTYKSMEVKDNKAIVSFNNVNRGITPIWTNLKGFEIAGADKVFYPASAEVDTKTNQIVVWSDKVVVPVSVRYAFKNFVEASIFNVSGIPAAPFRTDNW